MRSSTIVTLATGCLLLGACGGSDESADTDVGPTATGPAVTEPATSEPATSDPATSHPATTDPAVASPPADLELVEAGPYDVGVQTITITDPARNRPLTVDVWFPIDDAGNAPLHQYTLIPGVFYESPTAVDADASALAADAPFPLVVYSHGSGGLRYLASDYTETIASHGYVVAAPDHTGNTALERLGDSEDDFDVIALNRPQDVAAVIDAMTDPANPATAGFAGGIDPERIAVTGHSFGGFTAYAMASGYTNALGTFAADPRVDAIIPLAPATGNGDGRLLTDDDLAAVTVPALVMVGTDDRTTPPDPNVERPWTLSNSEPRYRVDLVAAEHQSFSDMCSYQQAVPLLADVPQLIIDTIDAYALEGCSPDDMPIDRAQDLTNTFAVTFLDSVFRDGVMIDPDAVALPDDVIFAVEGGRS